MLVRARQLRFDFDGVPISSDLTGHRAPRDTSNPRECVSGSQRQSGQISSVDSDQDRLCQRLLLFRLQNGHLRPRNA